MNRHQPDAAFEWNKRFDDAVKSAMTSAPAEVLRISTHQDFDLAVPTPEHFIPLLYIAGLASAAGRPAEVLVEGYAMGSLSMTAYTVDAQCHLI